MLLNAVWVFWVSRRGARLPITAKSGFRSRDKKKNLCSASREKRCGGDSWLHFFIQVLFFLFCVDWS
jgi:hypothetical protein